MSRANDQRLAEPVFVSGLGRSGTTWISRAHLEFLHELFSDAYYVLIYRDGRDYVDSDAW